MTARCHRSIRRHGGAALEAVADGENRISPVQSGRSDADAAAFARPLAGTTSCGPRPGRRRFPSSNMHLLLLGSDHRSGSLAQLGALRAAHDAVLAQLLYLRATRRCAGAVLVDTCNRFEVLLDLGDDPADHGELQAVLFGGLPEVPLHDFVDHDAVLRLLRTAAGLESLVTGEDQILGQLSRAFQEAKDVDLLSPSLQRLWDRCVGVARQLRSRRPKDRASKSVAELAARVAREAGPRVALVGAGATARVAIETLQKLSTAKLWVYNRTPARAQALAAHFGAVAGSLDDLLTAPPDVDAVLLAIAGCQLELPMQLLPNLRRVVDASQPSVLASSMRGHAGVEVFDLQRLASRGQEEAAHSLAWQQLASQLAAGHGRRIWQELVGGGVDGSRLGHLVDLHLAAAREEVEKGWRHGLGDLSPEQRAALVRLAERIARRNAHMHVKDLQQAVRP